MGYYETAAGSASSENQALAKQRLAEVGRLDAAQDAEADRVVQAEAAAVLAAGDDALSRGDYDGAMARYRSAYDGVVEGKPKYQAALGIARACAYLGNLDEAAQFAEYVAENADAELSPQGKVVVDWIAQQRAASGAAADGTTPDEFRELRQAAETAFFSQAYDQALPLYLAATQSEQVAGVDRAKMAFNAGMCQRFLGNDAEARELFEYAAAHGPDSTAAKARDHIAKLDRLVAAAELVAELAD